MSRTSLPRGNERRYRARSFDGEDRAGRGERAGTALDISAGMKNFAFCVLVACGGCATTQPFVLSNEQVKSFRDVVRDAEAAGAADGPPEAVQRLSDAKSEFEYSQHLPLYPDRARQLAAKAQTDAEAALALAHSVAQARIAVRQEERHEVLAGSPTP
jgi:hypothetical protein